MNGNMDSDYFNGIAGNKSNSMVLKNCLQIHDQNPKEKNTRQKDRQTQHHGKKNY